jgi:hypothetical protein
MAAKKLGVAMPKAVAATYLHRDKPVTPAPVLALSKRRLKWYRVAAPELPVPPEIDAMARAFLAKADLEDVSEFGFVVLHRCGPDFYFLIICSWRGNNEIWETVYAKDKDDANFRGWPRLGPHLPTYCVWEMGAVAHESRAWRRYLMSARDEPAASAWLADQYEGEA